MRTFYIKVIGSLLIVGSIACVKPPAKDQTWEMLSLGLPDKITPQVAHINMGFYILKQTHEPLFRYNDDGQFYSKVLSSWSRSIDNRQFILCPNQKLVFSNEIYFTTDFLKNFISRTATKLGKVHLNLTDQCLSVLFDKPQEGFLRQYSDHELSPSIPSNNPRIEYGLGPFVVESISSQEIDLRRKDFIENGYNVIRVINYKGRNDPNLNNKFIEDFNRVYISDLPSWVKEEYANYGVMLSQSINLLINHPDKELRDIIYNCLDIERFRKAFMPLQEDFYSIENILPVGMVGAKKGLPSQQCKLLKPRNFKLKFVNWKQDNVEQLFDFFRDFFERLNIQINIENISASEFLSRVSKKPHRYELTVIALDAIRPDYRVFYEYLINGRQAIVDYDVPRATEIYNTLVRSEGEKEKRNLIEKLNDVLKKEAVILPLYQEVRRFYYPKHIKNLRLGKDFLEYPEIADFIL